MQTFKELYESTVRSVLDDGSVSPEAGNYDPYHLDCLLNPEKHPIVIRTGKCNCSKDEKCDCLERCPFGALSMGKDGVEVDPELCLGCDNCIEGCAREKLTASTDIIPALKAIRGSKGLVYAMIAPAFLGQFTNDVTPGKLRNALKEVGFDGMLEVALFADILTLKEALEFDKNIVNDGDFQLTSCCCPMWIGMIRKVYHQLLPHVPGSVSPMVACANVVKALHPDAMTVFIGPCLAKKAEAREKDLVGAVDYVLTFQEVKNIFDALGIDPADMEESEKDHSSRAGRIYARKGGVSEAVELTVKAIDPEKKTKIITKRADGVPACKKMIQDIMEGNIEANFYEGMGCVGGCVGGPRSILDVEHGTKLVNEYGKNATYQHPAENPYVIELLHRLNLDTIESLLEETDLFSRNIT
ncbi:[Fe-Fe] hydrogenase large subunit C-terminal domain-containing protein [Lacrimispora aerotolerans]|jgi:iron only hydrogenase large subunit-like protein|uniref:[Fe-Fe] hydrogenase large subunit C-terminal domain-containing protein n=1 Tax=Lacrimispora aerotolerans TaxID=36832 RepID=UPI00047C87BF|nr:[Fe-Fe] hydrogenase large subunit C-terminal domain-containing protein [Lacrimispora aerotolerans]